MSLEARWADVSNTRWVAFNALTTYSWNSRDQLVYGDYLPVANVNCGLRDPSLLTPLNLSSTTQVTLPDSGQYFVNREIYGDYWAPTGSQNTDIIFENCKLRGGSHVPNGNSAVINAQSKRGGTGRIILIDCEIDPQLPALNREAARGNRVEIYRTWTHDTIDGFHSFAYSDTNSGRCDFYAYGCLVEDLRYCYPDYKNGVSGQTEHNDGTHNDCWQHDGGSYAVGVGNYLRGVGTALPISQPHPSAQWTIDDGYTFGQCLLVTKATGVAPDATCSWTKNWLEGARQQASFQTGTVCTYTGNRHLHSVASGPGSSGYWIRFNAPDASPLARVYGVNDAGNQTITNTTNVWADSPNTGVALTTPRTSGVHFN